MSLGQELARLGFYQSGFHASLIGEPDADGHADGEVEIEQVATAKTMEDYLDAYVAGWGIPEKDHAQFKSNVRPWLEQAGWSLYLARVNGRPAAAATLYVHDRVGYLADSVNRSFISPPRPADRAAAAAHARRRHLRGRSRFQWCRAVLVQSSQYGTRRHAPAIRSGKMDAG